MVNERIVGGIIVAAAALTTLIVGGFLVRKAGGEVGPEEELPITEMPSTSVPAGSLGSVVITIEEVQKSATANDVFTFVVRYSNISDQEQTFDAIMQIKSPNGQVQQIKSTKVTIPGRSSRTVRFFTGNLFELSFTRGIWLAEFFAFESLEVPIPFADDVSVEFIVDVLNLALAE